FQVVHRLERHAGIAGDLLARKLASGVRIDPVLLVRDVECARNMTAANGADILASELLRRTRVHDLHIGVIQPLHHFPGGDRDGWIDRELERNGRPPRSLAADRPPGSGPVLDSLMVDADIAAAEIPHGVKPEIRVPAAPAAIDDDLALGVETSSP